VRGTGGTVLEVVNLKSFDEFLARRFPESRRKAYYLMSIHEHLPPQARRDLKEVGWGKDYSWRRSRDVTVRTSIVQPGCTRRANCRKKIQAGGGEGINRKR
jgi:hypothetical protein